MAQLPYGAPTRRGIQIAEGALRRLAEGPRRPQRDLERLAAVWGTPRSGFLPRGGWADAEPTLDGMAIVAHFVDAGAEGIAVRALRALEAATRPWSFWQSFRDGRGPLDWPGWSVAFDVVAASLQPTAHPHRRLAAASLVASAPHEGFPLRELAERESLYTVRWWSIRALALLGDTKDLAELLAACPPHGLSEPPERWRSTVEPWAGPWAFLRAAEACVGAGVTLIAPAG
ncbi:MAG: hypothetical protein H6721_28070 [Sandaracinus sp.]|nr:hypothetical protein [Sandaracinus sp.]MCB9615848.1 hypothetical protein [Sandaracinus sp.]MCB9635985.1 hypothetical protein [Sandaracinus sp.]